MKYIIIGGGIAGTTAAETIRSQDKRGEILIIDEESYPLYSRIMLKSLITDEMAEEQMFLKNPEFYKDNHIELLSNRKVVSVNTEQKRIILDNNQEVAYDKLLIASGAKPRECPIPTDARGVFYFRKLDDAKELKKYILENKPKKALIIGGGFISLELSSAFLKFNIESSILIREPYYWANMLDEDSSRIVKQTWEKNGIKIIDNEELGEIKSQDGRIVGIKTKNGKDFECDILCVGIGVYSDLKYLETSGIKSNRGVIANEYLETNIPDIWTAGDVAEFYDPILEEQVQLGNWMNAFAQGKSVGLNMTGQRQVFRTVSFYAAKPIFGTNIVFIGDASPKDKDIIIQRGSYEQNKVCRIFIEIDEIVGATLVNWSDDREEILELIKRNVKVGDKLEQMKDSNFDLKTLL